MSDESEPLSAPLLERNEFYARTCDECPSRGSYDVVGDFGRVETRWANAPSEIRYETIGFPERCKKCNARNARHTSAKEAILRLEIIREAIAVSESKYDWLKFVTLTFENEWTENPSPDVDNLIAKLKIIREELFQFGIVGGTDVIENVVKIEVRDGVQMYHHHLHTHGVWIGPYLDMDKLRKYLNSRGVGRFEYTPCNPAEYTCKYTGEQRVQSAINRATSYLAKYMSKETLIGRRRISWGTLRQWKQYVKKEICFRCVKTTGQIEKYDYCNCSANN